MNCLLMLALLLPSTDGQDSVFAESTLEFAESLLQESDYYRAVTEYKRFLFLVPTDPRCDRVTMRIGSALLLAGQYDLVYRWYEALSDSFVLQPDAVLLAGRGELMAGRPGSSLAILQSRQYDPEAPQFAENMFLQGLSHVSTGSYDEARQNFGEVGSGSPFATRAREYGQLLEEAPSLQPRSPVLAGILGVIPGAGYAYSGHYGTAAASLLVNGLLAWGTISAFQNDNDEAGYVLGVLGFGFFTGNIYGSIQSASRYNRWLHDSFREQFRY